MTSTVFLSRDMWAGAIIGSILGSIVIPIVWWVIKGIGNWMRNARPANKLLNGIAKQSELCRVFVRDFFIEPGTPLISIEPRVGAGIVPNVTELWPDVEGRAVARIFNVLGRVGKTNNIDIIRMSQDFGIWDSHIIVLGAQSNKSLDFYSEMKNVAYKMDNEEIYDNETNQIIERTSGFGYGIILKARNPFKMKGSKGTAFLLGGYGVLGTAAAAYYFAEKFIQLGQEFGSDCFGLVVRASVSAGEQAVERLKSYDKRFRWYSSLISRPRIQRAYDGQNVSGSTVIRPK